MTENLEMVDVRVAVRVSPDGSWSAFGSGGYEDDAELIEEFRLSNTPEYGDVYHILPATLPVPRPVQHIDSPIGGTRYAGTDIVARIADLREALEDCDSDAFGALPTQVRWAIENLTEIADAIDEEAEEAA